MVIPNQRHVERGNRVGRGGGGDVQSRRACVVCVGVEVRLLFGRTSSRAVGRRPSLRTSTNRISLADDVHDPLHQQTGTLTASLLAAKNKPIDFARVILNSLLATALVDSQILQEVEVKRVVGGA